MLDPQDLAALFANVEARPKRRQGITGQTIEAMMRGTMCQITEYELDALRDEIARLQEAVNAEEMRANENKARAEKAEAALSESQALLAAAFDVAAKYVQSYEQSGVNCNWRGMADTIRAKTPTDAKAALDARVNAAREEGYLIAMTEAKKLGAYIVAPEHCSAILAKIKEADHE